MLIKPPDPNFLIVVFIVRRTHFTPLSFLNSAVPPTVILHWDLYKCVWFIELITSVLGGGRVTDIDSISDNTTGSSKRKKWNY